MRHVDQGTGARVLVTGASPKYLDPVTPERRAAQQRATTLASEAARATHMSERLLAARLLQHRSVVAKKLGVSSPATINLADIVLAAETAPRFFAEIMRRLKAVQDEPPPSSLGHEGYLRRLAAEHGDVARTLDEALADGTIDANEARAIRKEILDVRRLHDGWLRELETIVEGEAGANAG